MTNIFKREFKREAWVMYITMFFLMFINVMNRLILHNNYEAEQWTNNEFSSFVPLIFLTGAAAIIIALYSFKFLHSKEQLDLEHSLPITRTELFLVKYFKGLIYFAIPYVIVFIALCLMDNLFYPEVVILSIELVLFCVKYVLIITFIYTIIIFANLICGTSLYSVCLSLLIIFFIPTFSSIVNDANRYISTTESLNILEEYLSLNQFIDYFVFDDLYKNFYSITNYLSIIVILIILTSTFIFLCLVLYNNRKSESAGSQIVFSKLNLAVNIFVVYSFSLLLAVSFFELDRSQLFGYAVSVIIVFILGFINQVSVYRGFSKFKLKKYIITVASASILLVATFSTLRTKTLYDLISFKISSEEVVFANFDISSDNFLNMNVVLQTPIDFDSTLILLKDLNKQNKAKEYGELVIDKQQPTEEELSNFITLTSNIIPKEKGFFPTTVWYLDKRNPEDIALLDKIISQNTNQSVYSIVLNTFENITSVELTHNDRLFNLNTDFNGGIKKYPYYESTIFPIGGDTFRTAYIKDLAEIAQSKPTRESVIFDYLPLIISHFSFGDYKSMGIESLDETNLPITKEWSNTLSVLEIPPNSFRVYDIADNEEFLEVIDEANGVFDYGNQISTNKTSAGDLINKLSNNDFTEYTTEEILSNEVDIKVYTLRITSFDIVNENFKLIVDNATNKVYFGIVE